jgi:HAMP domain-containing protein
MSDDMDIFEDYEKGGSAPDQNAEAQDLSAPDLPVDAADAPAGMEPSFINWDELQAGAADAVPEPVAVAQEPGASPEYSTNPAVITPVNEFSDGNDIFKSETAIPQPEYVSEPTGEAPTAQEGFEPLPGPETMPAGLGVEDVMAVTQGVEPQTGPHALDADEMYEPTGAGEMPDVENANWKKRRWWRFLVSGKYQVGLLLYSLLVTFLTVGFFGLFHYLSLKKSVTFLVRHNVHLSPEMSTFISDQRFVVYMSLATLAAFLSVALVFTLLRLSHRVAGPVYSLNRKLKEMSAGDYTNTLRLRDKDQFKYLEESFEELRRSLAVKTQSEVDRVESIARIIRSSAHGTEAHDFIEEYLEEKKAELEHLAA